jgi:insertion element IS1 protein InsB
VLQCDELWSFVGSKRQVQWVWIALDADSRQVVALAVGARDESGARALWENLPEVYRLRAFAYTDFWRAYSAVLPKGQHEAVGKETGLTSYVERFNNTARQRISRLVRKTLSFSKKLQNHIGALWYFVHHYNLSLLV